MNRNVIGTAQRLLELHIFDPGLFVLNAARVAQIHQFLDGGDELFVLIRRVVAENVYVEPRTFFNHRQTNASGADDGDGFSSDFVTEERQKRVPRRPLLFAHEALALPHSARKDPHNEKRELGCGFSEDISRVRKRDFIFVSVSAIDVVEAYSNRSEEHTSELQ